MDNLLILSDDGKEIIGIKDKSVTNVNIPNDVTSIGNGAFSHCESLLTVYISNGVTSIGESAFQGCTSLEDVNIPISVCSIGESAFSFCKSLKKIQLPYGLRTIERSVFESCSSLEEIVVSSSITHIEGHAFDKCISLDHVNLPDSVVKIAGYAFSGCTSLSDINIPKKLERIGNWSFERTALKSVNISIEGNVIGEGAFAGCKFLEHVVISYGITKIRERAFASCPLLKFFQLPSSIKEVQREVFEGCISLTEIILEDNDEASKADVDLSQKICANLNAKLYNHHSKFSEISPFVSGLSKFKKDGKYGLIDSDGTIVKDAIYNALYEEDGYIQFEKNDKEWGLMTYSLNELFSGNFYCIKPLDHFLFLVCDHNHPGYGILDVKGNVIVPLEYEEDIKIVGDLIIATESTQDCSGYTFRGRKVFEHIECYNIRELVHGLYLYETSEYPGPCYYGIKNPYPCCNIIDNKGKVIFERDYWQIKLMENGMLSILSGDGWGVADLNGKIIVEPFYKKELSFQNGISTIEVIGSPYKHEVDLSGNIVIHNKIETKVINNDGISISRYKNEQITLDNKHYYWGTDFINDLCIVRSKKNYRVGVIDRHGSVVIPAIYHAISILSNGQIILKKDELLGVSDPNGKFLLPPVFESIRQISKDRIKAVFLSSKVESWSSNGEYKLKDDFKKHSIANLNDEPFIRSALFDQNGRVLTSKFLFIGRIIGNYAVAYKEIVCKKVKFHQRAFLYKCGIINLNGDVVLEANYRWIKIFKNEYAIVLGDSYGMFNIRTKTIIWYKDANIGFVWDIDNYGRAIFTTNSKYEENGDRGVVDMNGILVPPQKYDYIEMLDNGLIKVAKNVCALETIEQIDEYHSKKGPSKKWYSQWGLLDKSGREIIPCVYSQITDFFCGKAAVCEEGASESLFSSNDVKNKDGKWGIININGFFEVPCSMAYSKLTRFFKPEKGMDYDTFCREFNNIQLCRLKAPKDTRQIDSFDIVSNPEASKVVASDSVTGLNYFSDNAPFFEYDHEEDVNPAGMKYRYSGVNDTDWHDNFDGETLDELPIIGGGTFY